MIIGVYTDEQGRKTHLHMSRDETGRQIYRAVVDVGDIRTWYTLAGAEEALAARGWTRKKEETP